jgi:hypothetical protein
MMQPWFLLLKVRSCVHSWCFCLQKSCVFRSFVSKLCLFETSKPDSCSSATMKRIPKGKKNSHVLSGLSELNRIKDCCPPFQLLECTPE